MMVSSVTSYPYLLYPPYFYISSFNPMYPLIPVGSMNVPSSIDVLPSSSSMFFQFMKSQVNALVGLTSYMSRLKSSAQPLDLSSPNNVWLQRTVTSSVPTSISGTAANGAKLATYTIDVSQIATAQQNAGTALSSNAATSMAPGTHTFSITIGGTTKNISFAVAAGDTNLTVLNKMAQSINAANVGVLATVSTNASAGTSQLIITANKTGTAYRFSLADVSGTAVATTGANTIVRAAADALYAVNGISYTSSSNTVILAADPKVSLTFTAPVNGAKITVGYDTAAISSALSSFVDAYNATMTYLSQNQQFINPQLAHTFKMAFNKNAVILQQAGITANLDGTLRFDQTLFTNSLKTNVDNIKQALGGISGLVTESKSLAQSVMSSPLTTYAKPMVPNFSTYTPFGWNWAPFNQQWIDMLFNGMLFNRLI